MADRIPCDHPTIRTLRGQLERHGGSRLRIRLAGDDAAALPTDEVVRVIVAETTRFSRPTPGPHDGSVIITGVYDSPSVARNPGSGTDRLQPWLRDLGRRAGQSVLVDVVEPGVAYGLREPGEHTVYTGIEGPKPDLASIARALEDEDR